MIENTVPSMRSAEHISKAALASDGKAPSMEIDLGDFDAPSSKSKTGDLIKSADLDLNFDDFDKSPSSNIDDDIYAGL